MQLEQALEQLLEESSFRRLKKVVELAEIRTIKKRIATRPGQEWMRDTAASGSPCYSGCDHADKAEAKRVAMMLIQPSTLFEALYTLLRSTVTHTQL